MEAAPRTPARRLAARVPGALWAARRWYRLRARREQADARRRVEARRLADERVLRELAARDDLRINVGSSDNALAGWVNVDLRPGEGSLVMDATRPWPFRDGSAVAVNSEHFIEHLTVDEALAYLREAFRVLRPGGVLRTCTPDLEGLCRAYLEGDPSALAVHRAHGYDARTHADMLNNYVYLWGHRRIWDFESLTAVLADAGFADVARAPFNRSSHALLDGIDRHDPGALVDTVLCVDAVRP